MGVLQRRGLVVANRVLSGDYRKLIANEAGSFEYYRAFGGSGNFYCEILRSLNTPPPLRSPAQVINSDQFLMIQQLIVVIR